MFKDRKSPSVLSEKDEISNMVNLLKDKQEGIKKIFGDFKITPFRLFGDRIPETASGIAKINILVENCNSPTVMEKLGQSLETLLDTTVNVYTEQTLENLDSKHYQAKINGAKTLDEIINKQSLTMTKN